MLSKDFREFIELLNYKKIKYLIVGGYALAVYGYPRYTKDLDIWVWSETENAVKIIEALKEFGFGHLNLTENDFTEDGYVIQLGVPPLRIDLLTSLTGVDFGECYHMRREEEIDGVKISFIGLDCFKRNKRSTHRLQDLADLELLEER